MIQFNPHYIPPPNNGIELIYCDDSLLVVNKPAGLLSVPGRGEDRSDCLVSRVQQEFPEALIVHRLDMATSGMLLFARSLAIHRLLSALFRDRCVEKRYVAVVSGKLLLESGEVNLPIGADWANRPLCKIDAEEGKPSLTRYRLLSQNGDTCRVELEPVTGRTHQLRLHMAALGHPILGDAWYGDPASADRLLLHAQSLSFPHPISQQLLTLECPAAF